jgi:vitellogenic carboxypeptidase-like protein
VKGLKPRAQVVLKDLASKEDDELDEETIRQQTSTSAAIPDTYAGYVNVDNDRGSHLFFWMAEARDGNREAPVIVYLMGGPGAPSCALMVKSIGPREVDADAAYKLIEKNNLHSWNQHYAIIFIDQPIGIGFSFTEGKDGFARQDEQVAAHVTAGIPTILHRFGKMDNPLYIFGSSYGGKIAPSVAEGLMVSQEDESKGLKLNVKGVGIGSGWVHPLSIVKSYPDFFFDHGYINGALKTELEADVRKAVELIEAKKTCEAMKYLVEDGVILSKVRKTSAILNWYNLRKAYDPAAYFHDLTASLKFVDHVHPLLPVGGRSLEIANGGVNFTAYDYLACAIAHSSIEQVDSLLKRKIRVLVYGGEDDAMVPASSTTDWLKSLSAGPALEWLKQSKKPWSVNGKVAGFWRTDADNLLNEVLVLKAGHLVEKDKPDIAKEMVELFVQMG